MKVKYKKDCLDKQLEFNKEYNVFSIEIDNKNSTIKYYINNSKDGILELYWHDSKNFEIVDEEISQFWKYWINQFWDYIIWPKEIYSMEWFWEKLYDDIQEYEDVINHYFQIGKTELFN